MKGDIDHLEKVQRMATKMSTGPARGKERLRNLARLNRCRTETITRNMRHKILSQVFFTCDNFQFCITQLNPRNRATIFFNPIIIIITTTMFMVLSSWQSHCESSPGSFDECRMAPSGRSPKTKPDDLGCESVYAGCQKLHPPSPFIIITQPVS